METLLNAINEKYYAGISMHQFPELVEKYNLSGFHFSYSYPYQKQIADRLKKNHQVSISTHTKCEIGEYEHIMDYMFLSPLFPSVSKKEEQFLLDKEKISNYLLKGIQSKIIALSGIHPENAAEAFDLGFDGIAVLGSIWEGQTEKIDTALIVQKFSALKKAIQTNKRITL